MLAIGDRGGFYNHRRPDQALNIVAAILDETLPSEVTLFDLASGTPLLWDEQRAQIQFVCRVVSLAEPDD